MVALHSESKPLGSSKATVLRWLKGSMQTLLMWRVEPPELFCTWMDQTGFLSPHFTFIFWKSRSLDASWDPTAPDGGCHTISSGEPHAPEARFLAAHFGQAVTNWDFPTCPTIFFSCVLNIIADKMMQFCRVCRGQKVVFQRVELWSWSGGRHGQHARNRSGKMLRSVLHILF